MKCWKCGRELTPEDKMPGAGNVYECPYPCEAENYGPDEEEDAEEN